MLFASISLLPPSGRSSVTAYAYGTDTELTAAGAVVTTGTISDSGEMKGHPLMFYLSGKGIDHVRFSCKNHQISFLDWTQQREEYGLAQNFTVPYGENAEEYGYLTVDWVPNATIRELTDHEDSRIPTLPGEMREDIIVMEIAFADGSTQTKAIWISLREDGTFFASFDDYEITEEDSFVHRPDSEPLSMTGVRPSGEEGAADVAEGGAGRPQDVPSQEADGAVDLEGAEKAAREYYAGTVFEVISLEAVSAETLSSGEGGVTAEVRYSVRVSKGGVVQDPDRSITLQQTDGVWKVVGEGY